LKAIGNGDSDGFSILDVELDRLPKEDR
jgi:hypothetical protein